MRQTHNFLFESHTLNNGLHNSFGNIKYKEIMQTIFITGASSGLGKAAAKLFADKGWKVIATMRNPEKGADLASHENITVLPLDITKTDQISATIAKAISMGVDVVFNNAGVGLIGPLEASTDEQIQKQLDINFLSVVRVTRAFIPYFREQKKGLFLATTSIGGLITFPFNTGYCASKWAVEGFYESLSFELSAFNIGVKTISPGAIHSSFRDNMEFVQNEAYTEAFNKMYQAFMTGKTPTSVSPAEEIAQVVFEAATDGKKQIRYVAGKDANIYIGQREQLGAEQFRTNLGELFFGEVK
jgi:NAD(P)-dependent dehydrogenase (short-subunit alcohol dehydrogenase family)